MGGDCGKEEKEEKREVRCKVRWRGKKRIEGGRCGSRFLGVVCGSLWCGGVCGGGVWWRVVVDKVRSGLAGWGGGGASKVSKVLLVW